MTRSGGISITLLHEPVSTTCDVALSFAFSQLTLERTHLCVGLLKALGEVLAMFLILLTWLFHWKVKTLHRKLL